MAKLGTLLKPFLKDTLVTGSVILSGSIFAGSVINYITQIFMGRFMSIEDYGTFNSLFSLTMLISIPSIALLTSLIKIVANLRVNNDFESLTKIYKDVTKYLFLIGILLGLILILLRNQVLDYLNIKNQLIIYPFVGYTLFSLVNNIPSGYLQGLLRFKGFGFYTIFRAVIRLAFVMALVISGYKVMGAMLGVTIGAALSYLVGILLLKKNLSIKISPSTKKHFKELLTFSIAVLAIKASLTFISSVDLVLVKHYFNPKDAGIYAGLTTIGKVILFGTGILSTVMFTIISDTVAKKQSYKNKLLAFSSVQLLIVLASVAIFYLFPGFITHTMFGKAYTPAIQYLPKYSIVIGLFSFVNFIYQFLLATENSKSYYILFIGVIIQFILINIFHDTLDTIININILTMCSILAAVMIPFKKADFSYNKS